MGFLRWRPDVQSEWLRWTVRGCPLMMAGYSALGREHSILGAGGAAGSRGVQRWVLIDGRGRGVSFWLFYR